MTAEDPSEAPAGGSVPRVVLDMNVVATGLRSTAGASFEVLIKAAQDRFVIAMSVPLFFEYEDVLSRPALNVDPAAAQTFLDFLTDVADFTVVDFLIRPSLRDQDDEHVLELAVMAGCGWVVTYNVRDLAGFDRYGVRVVTPAAFLEEID